MIQVDDADARLEAEVSPSDWKNPEPRDRYDFVVLGGGTAGLVSAAGAAGLGARVALVERRRLGGDCLNTGCVPSKALLRSARAIGELRRAAGFGVEVRDVSPDFSAVLRRMRERRAALAVNDSAARFTRLGVDVFFGEARFSSATTIEVDGRTLRFNRAVIATGGRATAPPIPGLDTVDYLTNETLFDLTELPRRLGVIGAGAIGCEMAQAFARFGSDVTVFDQAAQILPREDADAAAIVARSLERDGVRFELGVKIESVESASVEGSGLGVERSSEVRRIRFSRGGGSFTRDVDTILVAAGRAPNIETLNLDAAGIRATRDGVVVDDRLRTANRRVYAAGDVCSSYKFTHAADAQARIVIQNALFFGRRRASALVMPWVTYTDPELAQVGVTTGEGRIETITVQLRDVDRAVLDDEDEGFVRIHHERGRLVGCTIVAAHAGDLLAEAVYAMTHGGTLATLSSTLHPYPTQGDALRRAGDAYHRTRLTPSVRRWLDHYFRWTR